MHQRVTRQSKDLVAIFVALVIMLTGCGSTTSTAVQPDSPSSETGSSGSNADDLPARNNDSDATSDTNEPTEPQMPMVSVSAGDQVAVVTVDDASELSQPVSWQYRWRETDAGTWSVWSTETVATNDGSPYTTTLSSLQNGTNYELQVRWVFADEATSKAQQTTFTPFTIPGNVQDVTVTPGNRSLEIAFGAPTNNGGSPIEGYRYRYRPTSGAWTGWSEVSTTTVSISGLANRAPYDVEVKAYNRAGAGGIERTTGTPDWDVALVTPPENIDDSFGWDIDASGNHLVVNGVSTSGDRNVSFFDATTSNQSPFNSFTGAWIGDSVALDGDLAAAELWNVNDFSAPFPRARVYKYNGSGWQSEADISVDWADPGTHYRNHELDIHGNQLAISTIFSRTQKNGGAIGAVEVFERDSDGNWTADNPVLEDPNADPYSWFGYSVAISDGVLAVGAPYDFDSGQRSNDGYVYVFEKQTGESNAWIPVADGLSEGNRGGFGHSVSLDGDRLAVGAPQAGKVYVYERNASTSSWQLTATIQPPQGFRKGFGQSVSLDDGLIAVGRWVDNKKGNVFVYENGDGAWQLFGELIDDRAILSNQAEAGTPVVLDQNRLFAGAFEQNNGLGQPKGGVFVFDQVSDNYISP